MAGTDPRNRELSLMDKQISSLLEICLNSNLYSINLHCNQISKIEGLRHLCYLQHLDLSSNLITKIEGLDSLASLQSLNLSCNKLTRVEGLEKLFNLKKLNLSYNSIQDLTGLIPLHGWNHKLSHLYLHSNCINSIDEVLQSTVGLNCLLHLTLEQNAKGNPVCHALGYREIILENLPQLNSLDGLDRSGDPVTAHEVDSMDLANLDFLEYLITFDSGRKEVKESLTGPVKTARIDEVLTKYRKHRDSSEAINLNTDGTSSSEHDVVRFQDNSNMLREMRIKKLEDQISELLVKASCPKSEQTKLKAKRDTDITTESDSESTKENRKGSTTKRTPGCHKTSQTSKQQANQQLKGRTSYSELKQNVSRKQSLSKRKTDIETSLSSGRTDTDSTGQILGKPHAIGGSLKKKGELVRNSIEESTYRALVQELDQERERRWKAEQVVLKLTENIKELQSQAKEEKGINSMAVYTTDRIKELLLKEKNAKSKLQELIHHLREENEKLMDELKKLKCKEEDYQKAYKSMEDTLAKLETQNIQKQALEMKQVQETERKVSASQREIDLLRVALRQQKEKVNQLHEVLTSKEQLHRKELESRVALNGPEFQYALAQEMAKEEHHHSQQIHSFQEKINLLTQQYADLEDEFRAALIIEAERFKEVKDGFDNVASELAEHKETVHRCRQKEKQSATLMQELTTMVKEQKARIAEITKAKQEIISDLKSKIHSLEKVAEEGRQKTVQTELLKKEKSKLISQLTAQESLIDGLKAERKIWGQELTQQGVSLAQDRGRLEAKIEVLSNEIESLKKQNERDADALRIKTKIVDDQTETIRKLKEGLQERDERIRKLREENIELEKVLQEQSDERTAQLEELKQKLERQTERKEEVKQLLEEKEAELEDVKKAYSAMNKKWQDKAELLSHLETQVRQMKENFDAKENKLIEERDKSLQCQKVITEKLRSVDDAFRRQLESVLSAHQAELIKLASDKQKEIEAANERVYQVEEEMRHLLKETANSKKIMEEKIKRLTGALSDIQKEF
ncbi:leucine-rich repeat and coiled-coil domain-containing protein 1 [Xenopus laevis]|uniref:Leucine-rich repeat and coiled-coil domain-containing protein 1 n=1 Tax=Xenopus laevis TaxID=8355 RepID=LRCC1_XENLA|nr:leucine-rich repeat and coiled-coil domain-containing protein 1 [Xenopus laevis]Q6NRC9.1 RecName: Full=Leucine-rich repeat and coiled-coil domain-containing protein 1 [Xenopus laevis]AAH70827.1 Lrrcc1 protein [Xenopus laevis]